MVVIAIVNGFAEVLGKQKPLTNGILSFVQKRLPFHIAIELDLLTFWECRFEQLPCFCLRIGIDDVNKIGLQVGSFSDARASTGKIARSNVVHDPTLVFEPDPFCVKGPPLFEKYAVNFRRYI